MTKSGANPVLSRYGRRALIALAAFGAFLAPAAMSPAADPVADSWRADPDAQFVLDVNLHRMTYGSGARAYQTPQGACVLLGDFLSALDIPVKVDLDSGTAQGWAFAEKNKININRRTLEFENNGKRDAFSKTDIRETPDGWCVDQKALARWFGLSIKADVYNSVLSIDTDRKLPVELAAMRRLRGEELARKHQAALARSTAPGVKIPYKLWRTPALEVVVSAGVRYGGGANVEIRHDATVYGAGELAAMSYLASVSLSQAGKPERLWARLYRSDPDGMLLGPLHATHVAIGDVPGLTSTFHGAGENGRGLVVTNRPLNQLGNFDRTEFRGRLPDGWDAELYRNGTLVAFDSDPDKDGEYLFPNVDVLVGDNEYEIILHGPQGQEQHVHDTLNVGADSAPAGKLWYWAGVRQPGEDLLSFARARPSPAHSIAGPTKASRGLEALAQVQFGVNERTAVSALVRSALDGDQRVTYVEGAVRRSLGPTVIELAGMSNSKGEHSARVQALAKIGKATISASSLWSDGLSGFNSEDRSVRTAHRLGAGIPLKLAGTSIPISASAGLVNFSDGSHAIDGQLRWGTRVGSFDLANMTSYQKRFESNGQANTTITSELIGAARIGPVRLRGSAEAEIQPTRRLRGLTLDAYWSKSDRVEWNAGARYDIALRRGTLQVSHVRRLNSMAVSFSGEAGTDGSVGAGIRLSFSLDPSHSGLRPIRERLATQGLVHARVFEDLNENGRFDSGEPLAKKAIITTGVRQSELSTNDQGQVTVGGLSPYVPLAVGIDQSSLDNPALTPLNPNQVIVPRPGVAADVDIALVGGGSIEGFATKSDGSPYEGLDFQLLDEHGNVISAARSDLDGYIVFENIRYGRFSLRLDGRSASAIHAAPLEPLTVVINRDKPAARVGSIKIASLK